jgi:hypothetical protein
MRLALAATVLMGALFAAGCGGGDVDQSDYLKANQAVLDTLPTFPGATELRRQELPYYLSEHGPVAGYGTSVTFSVGPAVTDDDVVGFFIDQLPDSQHCEYETSIGSDVGAHESVTMASFYKDGVGLGVLTEGLSTLTPSDTFELDIDHEASKNSCTGEELK